MPKEQINYPSRPAFLSNEEDASATGEYTVAHIGWDKIGWVQLGLEVDLGYAEFAISCPTGSTPARTIMWTPVISPAEIDAMINTLRRAKRKAYGKQQ